MKCISIAANLITKLEGFSASAYKDSAGIITIGYGATRIYGRPVSITDSCTEEQAKHWVTEKVTADFMRLQVFCSFHEVELNDNQAAAILSFTYNAGFNAFNSSSMANDLILNKADKVANDLLKWNKIRVTEKLVFSQGLFNRRMQEAQLFTKKDSSAA